MNPSPDALRQSLQAFDFKRLFIQNLGWNNPKSAVSREILGQRVSVLAEVGSIPAFLVESPGELPDSSTRRAVHAEVSKLAHENLLVFVDSRASQTLWLYAKREKGKVSFQEHLYTRGQSGELFVAKLAGLFVDIGELDDEGALSVLEAGNKLQSALDVARVSKKFYADYKERREEILAFIHGLPDDKTRARYVTVLLNRLMFVYFLQKKGFLDGDFGYLEGKLVSHERAQPGESSARSGEPSARSSESSARSGEPSARSGEPSARSGESSARSGEPSARSGESSENPTFFSAFLRPLFFEAFARPERPAALLALVGQIPYLNGGLFLPHSLETEFPIEVEDRAFEIIFALFGKYSWYLNDKPDAPDDGDQLSPEVLGHIFEKFINDQKSAGAYYTPEQITDYLCERTVGDLLLDRVCVLENGALRKFESLLELQTGLTETKCRAILHELQKLRLLDPAVGSGAFLVAALKTLDDFYMAIYGWAMANDKPHLAREALGDDRNHPLPLYAIRRRIITENLYGVDLMEGAPDIARLRLFIALVQAAHKLEHLEPLPNIDFNILEGNSLIGMLSCQPEDFAFVNLDVNADFHDISVRKNRLIGLYKAAAADWKENLGQLKTDADALRAEEKTICDAATVAEWNRLGIRTTKPTPVGAHGMRPSFDSSDEATGKLQEAIAGKTEGMGAYHAPLQGAIAGKTVKRPLVLGEIQDLRPFHWAAEFADVMKDGGFDAIITNPPWEIWKPNAKEFFQNYSDLVTKKKMTIKEFETEQTRLLKDPEIADKWTAYAGQFPPVSEYFRVSPDYANQISVVNGKKAGTDINLYKLFVERCFALLKEDGTLRHRHSQWHLYRPRRQATPRTAVWASANYRLVRLREPQDDLRGRGFALQIRVADVEARRHDREFSRRVHAPRRGRTAHFSQGRPDTHPHRNRAPPLPRFPVGDGVQRRPRPRNRRENAPIPPARRENRGEVESVPHARVRHDQRLAPLPNRAGRRAAAVV